jgi:DNA-binding transcriptional MerR regulator
VTDDKSPEAFRTISEVAEELDLPQHVLRFWETRFPQIKPLKRGGNRRYYRPDDVELLRAIRFLLYDEGLTIKGVQKMLREQGTGAVRAEPARAYAPPSHAGRAEPALTPPVRESAVEVPLGSSELRLALADLREAERLLEAARRR